MRTAFVVLLVIALSSTPASGQQLEKPIRYTWLATVCASWNCAAAALILADGNRHVIVLPTRDEEHPWVVLRRFEEGSIFIPDSEPYTCEVLNTVHEAASRVSVLEDSGCRPLILNVPDDRTVVISLKSCQSGRRRVVR
jgi:hypothetical protein